MKRSILHGSRVSQHPLTLFPITPGGALFRSGDQALLILDERGCIQFCGDARLLGQDEDAISGTPVNKLIPSLNLREKTPGYNVAYVDFWFAGDVWRRHEARTPGGHPVHVDITLRATLTGGRHWFVGLIRRLHHPSQDCQPLRELFRTPPQETPRPWQTPRLHCGLDRQARSEPPAN